MISAIEYDLYLDESGDFRETSTDPSERAESSGKRRFASQLAGLLVQKGSLTADEGRQVLEHAFQAAELTPGHATEIRDRARYNRVVAALLPQLADHSWQPVRLVNAEQVAFGNRATTYVNMVAELVSRICRQKCLEGQPKISIELVAARVKLGETSDGEIVLLEEDEYTRRLTEHLAFVNIRRGLAAESAAWSLTKVRLGSGRSWPELQLCDLLSNASHDDYCRCDPDLRVAMKAAFGPYDQSLVVRELIERIEMLLHEGSLGVAIMALAEELTSDGGNDPLRADAKRWLALVLQHVASRGDAVRNPQLSVLLTWLQQIVELQRSLGLGYRVARWLQANVETSLRTLLGPERAESLDWFSCAVGFWALTACNHLGALVDARQQLTIMEKYASRLAGKWEHASLLVRGQIARAVHLTDCFEHNAAAMSMKRITECYTVLSELLNEEFNGGEARINSDLRAAAIGTWLQAEMFVGRVDDRRLVTARELSEQALEEFSDPVDRQRQLQYRCQLETAAGQFAEARQYLSHSLSLAESTHAAIVANIVLQGKQAPFSEGFALLHWLRLGQACCQSDASAERDAFLAALTESGLLESAWAQGQYSSYPAHGILRRVAVIQAYLDHTRKAKDALHLLAHKLDPIGKRQLVLGLVQAAAIVEVSAFLWGNHRNDAVQLLGCTRVTVATSAGWAGGGEAILDREVDRAIGSGGPVEGGSRSDLPGRGVGRSGGC